MLKLLRFLKNILHVYLRTRAENKVQKRNLKRLREKGMKRRKTYFENIRNIRWYWKSSIFIGEIQANLNIH